MLLIAHIYVRLLLNSHSAISCCWLGFATPSNMNPLMDKGGFHYSDLMSPELSGIR